MIASEPIWIEERDALALHSRSLALFGGAAGLRDAGLLASAIARAQQLFAYDNEADLITIAGAITGGIVQNHPFIDGNKRTGFIAGILFLELNGYRFTAPESAAVEAVLGLSSGALSEAEYIAFLRKHLDRI